MTLPLPQRGGLHFSLPLGGGPGRGFLFAFLIATALPALAQIPEVTYRFTAGPNAFAVELEFQAGPEDRSVLKLPTEFGSGRDLHRHIRKLAVPRPAGGLRDGPDAATRIIHHQPFEKILVTYEVADAGFPRLTHENFYDPLVKPAYFHFFGHALLAYPEKLDQRPVRVNMEWHGLAPNASLASSFGMRQSGAVSRWRIEAPFPETRHALYVGGDFRLHRVTIRGQPLFVAVRGQWPFADAAFVEATRKVVEAHRAFWDDFEFPIYLVTLMPNDVDRGSYGGTAVKNAFAMHVARDFTVPSDPFDFLIGHEHLHTWVASKIGSMPEGAEEALAYWFSEGFTNYLTHRLLVRSGVWTLERYVEAVNEVIAKYLASPAVGADNREVAKRFWTDGAHRDIPYQRGELLALHWNERLGAKGESLDAVMRSLRVPPAEREMRATDRLVRTLAPRLPGVERDIERYIDRGSPLPLGPTLLGPCFEARPTRVPEFDLGFDFERTRAAKKVIGLSESSAAHAAGLRESDALQGFSVSLGDTRRPVVARVKRDAGVIDLTWRPVRPGRNPIPQYFLRPGASGEATCKSWF